MLRNEDDGVLFLENYSWMYGKYNGNIQDLKKRLPTSIDHYFEFVSSLLKKLVSLGLEKNDDFVLKYKRDTANSYPIIKTLNYLKFIEYKVANDQSNELDVMINNFSSFRSFSIKLMLTKFEFYFIVNRNEDGETIDDEIQQKLKNSCHTVMELYLKLYSINFINEADTSINISEDKLDTFFRSPKHKKILIYSELLCLICNYCIEKTTLEFNSTDLKFYYLHNETKQTYYGSLSSVFKNNNKDSAKQVIALDSLANTGFLLKTGKSKNVLFKLLLPDQLCQYAIGQKNYNIVTEFIKTYPGNNSANKEANSDERDELPKEGSKGLKRRPFEQTSSSSSIIDEKDKELAARALATLHEGNQTEVKLRKISSESSNSAFFVNPGSTSNNDFEKEQPELSTSPQAKY